MKVSSYKNVVVLSTSEFFHSDFEERRWTLVTHQFFLFMDNIDGYLYVACLGLVPKLCPFYGDEEVIPKVTWSKRQTKRAGHVSETNADIK